MIVTGLLRARNEMGFFSRKTIISVSSVIYEMGEEPDKIPDIVASGAITAALRGNPVPRAIRDSIFDGMGIKMSQAYSYAKGKYYAGMPTGFPKNHDTKRDAVLDLLSLEYLESIFPDDAITLQSTATTATDDYATKMRQLVATEYNYDFFTDRTLSATGAVQVNAALEVRGPFLNVDLHPNEIGYVLVFANPDSTFVMVEKWYAAAQFVGYEIIIKRVIMEYSRNGGRSVQESYEYGGSSNRLNIYLDDLEHELSGTFPAIVLKRDNTYLDDDKFSGTAWETSPAYLTSKQYAKRLGLNVNTLLTQIKDNESAKDIDYCFVQPGVRLNSPNKPVIEYLFNYFNRLRLLYGDNKPKFDAWAATSGFATNGHVSKNAAEGAPAQSIHLYDPDNAAGSLDMEIAWRYMTYEEKTGTIDKFEREVGPDTNLEARYRAGRSVSTTEKYDITMFYLRKQLTSTTYAELAICGLRHENYVYKGHSVQSGVYSAIHEPDSDDGSGFILPLDYTIYITLSPRERLQLAQECMHMVFNCYIARKQKWYETSLFKVILFIIAAVIVVMSFGTLGPGVLALYSSISAALGTVIVSATVIAALAAVITAAILVAVSVTIQYLAKEAGQWAAEHWGPGWGAVVQIITTIALAWGAGQLNVGPGFSMTAATVADTVLMVGAALLSTMAAYTEYTYVALQDEIKTWQHFAEAENNPLKQTEDLMKEMFPELTQIQRAATMPKPESLDEFLGRSLATVDGLTNKLFLPIESMTDLTLTPRL